MTMVGGWNPLLGHQTTTIGTYIMKFANTTFTVATSINKDAPAVNTVVTLTESDVGEQTLMDSLTSGQSPRVRWQNYFRANGIPKTIDMSWEKWIGNPPKATVVTLPMTVEEIRAAATKDVDFLAEMKRQILAEMKQNDQNPTNKPNK